MAALTLAFQTGLEDGGDIRERRERRGSSREYWIVRSLTLENHEFLMPCWRMKKACFQRMLAGPRRAIIRRSPSCLMCRVAGAGRVPERKYTAGAGVLE